MKKYRKYIIALIVIIAFLISVCFIPISAKKLIPTIEKQISNDLGSKVHIDNLVMQIGPSLKLKTSIMHVMYEDGKKYAQLDAVKIYIPWVSIIKKKPAAKMIYMKNLTVRLNSDDKYLPDLVKHFNDKAFNEIPDLCIKNYKISYNNKTEKDVYMLSGHLFETKKIVNHKNFKISAIGNFIINNKEHINYDVSVLPKFDLNKNDKNLEIEEFLSKIKELDFHSDIIADLKLYKTNNDSIQGSGFVNIDNISVLDASKKIPKSFVYLTFWGDKASISSNIYTSQNEKVYLEGMLNNSQKPVIDLKVKTDDISIADLYKKVKIFAGLYGLKNIESIDGKLNANFNLKGDLNKIKSNGYLKITDANIRANGLKVDKINANIDLSNNVVNIADAVGYVNNSPIMVKGSVDKNINIDVLMDKVELKNLCPTEYGVKNGIISLAANIGGTLQNIVHKENLKIENLLANNNNCEISLEALKFDTNKNNTAYINNVSLKTPETALIKIPSLKLNIERDKITIPETSIYMPNSKITLKSNVTNYNNSEILFNTAVNGFINSSDIVKLNKNSANYPIKLTLNGNKSVQSLNAQVVIDDVALFGEKAVVNLISKLEKGVLKIDDLSVSSFNGKFGDDYKLNIKGQKKIAVSGIVEKLKNPVLKNIRIYTPQQFNLNIADTAIQGKCDLFLNGSIKSPEIVGQMLIQNLVDKKTQLAVSGSTADFNKNIVVINAPLIKLADSMLGVNAVVSTDISKSILIKSLNIKSKYLNLETLLAYKDIPEINKIPVEISDGKIYAERLLIDIYGSPVNLSAFFSDMKLSDRVLYLRNIASEIFNGKIEGALDFDMKDEQFKSKFMARGVSAAPIFGVISTRKDTISGVMDFDSVISGDLYNRKSLKGNVKFIVHNGRMSTLGKLEHLLYAQNVVADSMLRTSLSVVAKALSLKDTGLFKYLRGDINIVDGMANIKYIQSQGPLMALYMKGQYNPENDYAKLIILGRISDDVMSGLGAFGEFSLNKLMVMLTGEETKYNILPEEYENLPQLGGKNTKEFRSVINGVVDKPSSVLQFNWVSYSTKSLKQKEVPMSNVKIPSFVDELPY